MKAILGLKPKTMNFNYTYPTYLPTYPILSCFYLLGKVQN